MINRSKREPLLSSTHDDVSSCVETTVSEESATQNSSEALTSSNPQPTTSSKPSTEFPSTPSVSSPTKTLIPKEPLPDGIICGYSWLDNIARAATEEELRAYAKEKNWSDDLIWCKHCGRPTKAMSVDGKIFSCGAIYGTCMRMAFTSGDWTCQCCGAVVPAKACHTCGIPIVIEPLPGITVNSPEQLTSGHIEPLYRSALSNIEHFYAGEHEGKLISIYSFVLTDNTFLSTRSKCVCLFVFTTQKPYSETPVYHVGEIYDIHILENGAIVSTVASNDVAYWSSEEEALRYHEKFGYNFTKIK